MFTADFPRFDGTYSIDLDVDAITDPIRFSKPPFEAELLCHNGRRMTLIGAHLKSKAPHGAQSKQEAMLIIHCQSAQTIGTGPMDKGTG